MRFLLPETLYEELHPYNNVRWVGQETDGLGGILS